MSLGESLEQMQKDKVTGTVSIEIFRTIGIFFPSQCWCARLGRAKCDNQHWKDEPEVKEQRWVEVSQQFLSETVGILL